MLTAKSRLCRVQPPGAAQEALKSGDSSVFPALPQPAQRAADKEWRFQARAASGPRSPSRSRDGSRFGITDYRAAGPRYAMSGGRFGAVPGRQRQTRRLLPPTCSDGPTLDAPDCVVDQDFGKNRADAEPSLRASFCVSRIPFGEARSFAFWPSPHPRIRWTVASPGRAKRAHRQTRPPPPRVTKCPTKCLSMPPIRRRPGSSWSAAIASKNLTSKPPSASSCGAISTSPR